jgi:hypothetical protein
MLVHIVADYGHGDLAFAEVVQRILVYLPDAQPVLTPVPAFSTLAAGFCIAQLGLNDAPPGTLIYHNVAPREDDAEARSENSGERLAFARLPNGVRVVGVNAGHAFSFVREAAEELRWAAAAAKGSQFRSRDLFPEVASAIAVGRVDALADHIDRSAILPVPTDRVAYVDGYGNLKTTVTAEGVRWRPGTALRVRVGGTERKVEVTDGSFAVQPGTIAFAPGSSGWVPGGTGEIRWMELFLRGGNAWQAFDRPAVNDLLEFTAA